jgi:RHS repeat-associated protein
VSACASGGTVTLTSLNGGPAVDWAVTASATDTNPTYFSAPSFAATPISMSGGEIAGNLLYSYAIAGTGGYAPNGNLLSVADSVTGTWNYQYDNLNRVVTGTSTAGSYAGAQMSWSYDPFGNRTSEGVGGTATVSMPTSSAASYTAASNQVSSSSQNNGAGFLYDTAGNVLNDGQNRYLYDAESRLCAVQSVLVTGSPITGYIYDAGGTRVAKGSLAWTGSGSLTWNTACSGIIGQGGWTFTPTTSWVLGPGGEQVTEYSVSGAPGNYTSTWKHTNAFAGGKLLATYVGTDTDFALNDWLGTKRVEVSVGGCVISYTSLPFGNGLAPTTSGPCPLDATEHHYTQKERDAESGNDYFEARYYSSAMGRFMSPDNPKYAEKTNPQSWNLYAYVDNNPHTRTDPTGTNWFYVDGKWEWHDGSTYNGLKSDYNMLLRIEKTGDWSTGAEKENLTLLGHGEKDVLATGTGYSGSSEFHLETTPNRSYEINLNIRGGPSSERAIPDSGSQYKLGGFPGIQQLGDVIVKVPGGTGIWNFGGDWGEYRANLNNLNGSSTPFYLHGKDDYEKFGRTWTHGCTTEPAQKVLKTIFSLNPNSVGEGAKNGRLLVSVSGK